MKTIVLVAPDSSGHHEMYLRLLAKTVLECGHRVVAFAPKAARLQAWAEAEHASTPEQLRAIELTYRQTHHLPGVLSMWFGKMAWVHAVERMIHAAQVQPDLVFHTWLDNCLTPGLSATLMDALFPYPWTGIYFHPWYLRRKLAYARLRHGALATHAGLSSRRCPGVAVLDEGIAPLLTKAIHGKPVVVFPDFTDLSVSDDGFEPIDQIRARARGRKIVSLLGVLTKRKGMLMMVDVAQQMANDDWFFVFAGQYYRDSFTSAEAARIDACVASRPENCFFFMDRIERESHFNALAVMSDVLFAVYQGFYSSSNLMTKAAAFHKPILVSAGGLMGERAQKYGIGVVIGENSTPECVNALKQLGASHLPAPQYDAYAQVHSVGQLDGALRTLLATAGIHSC